MGDRFRQLVEQELARARAHALAYHSDHEGLGVMLEEFEELKAEVFKKREHRDRRAMLAELAQIGAICEKWGDALLERLEPHRFGHPDGIQHANDVGYGCDDGYAEDPLGGGP